MKQLTHFLKGVSIGATMMIPGVSGGTMALILGIYHDIINAISNIFKDFKKHALFLLIVGLGGVVGLMAISWIVDYFLTNYNYPTMFLFCGVVLGGLPVLFKESNVGTKRNIDFIWFIIGVAIVGGLLYLDTVYDKSLFTFTTLSAGSFIYLFVAGVIVSVALILPGISTSFLLLFLGLLEPTMLAIKMYNFVYLMPLTAGVLFGVMATTKLLEMLMTKKTRPTYLMIIGFVIASLAKVFPGVPDGINIIICLITFVTGYLLVNQVSKRYSS